MSTDAPAPQRKPTSRDVADLAGVSVATVSYVLNGRTDRRIGDAARARVLAAARELNYAPNESARSLKRQRTERICLIVDSIGVPTVDKLTRDLHAAADGAGHGVITMVVDSHARAGKAIGLLRQRIADGALIATEERLLRDLQLETLAGTGFPIVVFGNSVVADGFDVVRAPAYPACAEALDHLVREGRRRIAFIGHHHDFDGRHPSERYSAYRDAVARHDLDRDPDLTVTGADDRVTGYRAAERLLALPEPPDAVFAASDRAAISAIWAARDAGLDVPGDIAVIGVGNIADGEITRPRLTTVGLPALDYTGPARMLFERVLSRDPLPGREVVTPWTFIRRGSA